jgi:acyl-CoA synthetase (AMP-forming)/AMP-acid ligase II
MRESIFTSGLGPGPANFSPLNLPRFAVPRTVIFGPIPTSATGKIQKFELRQRVRGL